MLDPGWLLIPVPYESEPFDAATAEDDDPPYPPGSDVVQDSIDKL
jgi:hypothetical protein